MAQENINPKQQDNTPKWQKTILFLFAIGSCVPAIAAVCGLLGDAPGQCIKNWNYTRNYKKRLDMNFNDMVRRNQYYRNLKYNG